MKLSRKQRVVLGVLAATLMPWVRPSRDLRRGTLRSLVALGLVEERAVYPRRDEYRITPAGRRAIADAIAGDR